MVNKKTETANKSCFVIAPLGEEGTAVRDRSDKVFRHVLKPAVEACGYAPLRSDIEPTPGMIGQQIIDHLLNDDLVVADLTGQNANVFYELAIRHMVGKPVVQVIQKGEILPFDITQSRTIFLDHTDLDSVDACREEIVRQIRELERDPALIPNPMSQAMRAESLRQSDDPRDQRDAEILIRLDRLSAQVEMLLMDHYAHRSNHVDEAARVSEPPGTTLVNGNVYSGGPRVSSPVDDLLGASATLDEAVKKFDALRNVVRHREGDGQAGLRPDPDGDTG